MQGHTITLIGTTVDLHKYMLMTYRVARLCLRGDILLTILPHLPVYMSTCTLAECLPAGRNHIAIKFIKRISEVQEEANPQSSQENRSLLWRWASPALLPTQKGFRAGQSMDAMPALPRQLQAGWVLEDTCASSSVKGAPARLWGQG